MIAKQIAKLDAEARSTFENGSVFVEVDASGCVWLMVTEYSTGRKRSLAALGTKTMPLNYIRENLKEAAERY